MLAVIEVAAVNAIIWIPLILIWRQEKSALSAPGRALTVEWTAEFAAFAAMTAPAGELRSPAERRPPPDRTGQTRHDASGGKPAGRRPT